MNGLDFTPTLQIVVFAAFLALVNERLVEQFAKPLLARMNQIEAVVYVALATGIGLSLAFGVDFVGPVAEKVMGQPLSAPWAGLLLSALVVGGGSNFIHDLWPGV